MLNMMFLMIPYGAVIAYSSILAQEKDIMAWLPYFYICLVVGMLISKTSTQKVIDAGKYKALVFASIVVLILTMLSFLFSTPVCICSSPLFLRTGLRYPAAALSVLRHRNYARPGARRGELDLYALL